MKFRAYNLKGYNTFTSPFQLSDGDMIQCLNVDPFPQGAKMKRPGYGTVIGTMPNGSAVAELFEWHRNDGTTFFLYAFAGGKVYSSSQGTGAWTITGNGTLSASGTLGYTVLNDTLIVGDGVGSTRHSTDGTSFTNTSLAPIASYFENYQNRVYAGGTANTLFWSTVGDGTNWSSSGTADSSSVDIPGPGKINAVFKVADRLVTSKNSGAMFRWDGFTLVDLTTDLGPTSAPSIADVEAYKFYLNRVGFFGFGGDRVQLISNPIQRLIYNEAQTGIVGSTFDTAPGAKYRYSYFCSIGTVTDDFTGVQIANAITKYNYQLNEWGISRFAHFPTAYVRYKDTSGNEQLVFGDASGNIFQYGGTNTSDNGTAIEAIMEFVVDAGAPESIKEWKSAEFIFNPGNEAKVQVAASDTFTRAKKNYVDLGDCSDGVAYFRPPEGLRSRFLFVKVYEASVVNRFVFYGYSYDADILAK